MPARFSTKAVGAAENASHNSTVARLLSMVASAGLSRMGSESGARDLFGT